MVPEPGVRGCRVGNEHAFQQSLVLSRTHGPAILDASQSTDFRVEHMGDENTEHCVCT